MFVCLSVFLSDKRQNGVISHRKNENNLKVNIVTREGPKSLVLYNPFFYKVLPVRCLHKKRSFKTKHKSFLQLQVICQSQQFA